MNTKTLCILSGFVIIFYVFTWSAAIYFTIEPYASPLVLLLNFINMSLCVTFSLVLWEINTKKKEVNQWKK
jgi:hypothetical protein